MQLVDVPVNIPNLLIDLRYKTERNVLQKSLYDNDFRPALCGAALDGLLSIAKSLHERELGLVLWDAYRTATAQELLHAAVPDDRYVAIASNHRLGKAVDVTLMDAYGELLDMGSDHDEFSPLAHSSSSDISAEQAQNRAILIQAMEDNGFKRYAYEWWHFDFIGDEARES